ncbi:uncharacterized protein BXZ73DRAFT_42284 [Epithele typhae]|uniref:uncharacterized protein n=1 Tax=Epithele typhae TaxID=378194 RepID=UPI00200736D4|nr:uncharacterized protein BXZ73DRAFT_42284 [Epithele typhae]KAH9941259.1 hypothetical protein BXZ73DRAFT_42284 [Epithele typhae]
MSNSSQTTSQASTQQSSQSSSGIPQTAAAGSITVTKPPQASTSFYKIAASQTVTFAWNFTDVLSMPTHLTVHAVGANGNTYPVGPTDGIINGTATSVTWDLWSYQQANSQLPLAPGSYALHIWDDRGPDATRAPGLLSPYSSLQFALYTPEAYTPLESWTCATCNGASLDLITHPATVSLAVTFTVMFLSGYSLLRQAMR